MEKHPSALALVLLTIALVCTPAMEDHHAGVVSLGSSDVEPLLGEPGAEGGYDEIKGMMHVGLRSSKSMFQTSAECQGSCDADVKCQSYSYDPVKGTCITSQSSLTFNPNFKYYSRQPWLHKDHIDDDDGTATGEILGRYNVFTGLMYPEKANFDERFFITLDKCKDLCDSDAPAAIESNERMGKFDHEFKYQDDGCSAFAYSKEEERCLLKGIPISFNPAFNYYGKRSAMVETDSTKTPDQLKNDAKLANEIADQKKASEAAEKADADGAKKNSRNEVDSVQNSVLDEQKKISQEAKKAAKAKVGAVQEQAAVPNPRATMKAMKERKLKETTEKDLEKEQMMEAKDQRAADAKARERGEKKRIEENHETAAKMKKKTQEVAGKAKAASMSRDMNAALLDFIDRAVLLANNERDIKAAMKKGKEQNTKEAIVKAKVVRAITSRREAGEKYVEAAVAEKASEGKAAVAQDEKVLAAEEAKKSAAKNVLATETQKLANLKGVKDQAEEALKNAQNAVASMQTQIQTAGQSVRAEMTQKLQQAEMKKGAAEQKLGSAKSAYDSQKTLVKDKALIVKSFSPEIAEAKAAEKAAKQLAEVSKDNIKFEFYGAKPNKPTSEESALYRKYSKQYGLKLPEEPNDPVPAPPPPPKSSEL